MNFARPAERYGVPWIPWPRSEGLMTEEKREEKNGLIPPPPSM
jgi:hypothetical protein